MRRSETRQNVPSRGSGWAALSLLGFIAAWAFLLAGQAGGGTSVAVAGASLSSDTVLDLEASGSLLDTALTGSTAAAALQPTPLEQTLLDLTNEDRGAHGLPPVTFDPALLAIARARAADQISLPALSHEDARGRLVFQDLLDGNSLGYTLAGENLARGVGIDATTTPSVEQALMNSPLHRKNILEPAFDRLAVGAALDPRSGRVVFAEIYRAVS